MQFGPHWPKKELPKYIVMRAVEERFSRRKPHRQNREPVMRNPYCWSFRRPIRGLSTTDAAAKYPKSAISAFRVDAG